MGGYTHRILNTHVQLMQYDLPLQWGKTSVLLIMDIHSHANLANVFTARSYSLSVLMYMTFLCSYMSNSLQKHVFLNQVWIQETKDINSSMR